MTPPDPHALRVRWIMALNDADPDKQLRGWLTHDDHHCAIGIAASALQKELGVHERETTFTDVDAPSYVVTSCEMTLRLADLLEIDRTVLGYVVDLNDRQHLTFPELADHLKETIL